VTTQSPPDFGTFAREVTVDALCRAEGFYDFPKLIRGVGPVAGPFFEQAGPRMFRALQSLQDPDDEAAIAKIVASFVQFG